MRTQQQRNRILRGPAHKEGVWGVRQLGPPGRAGELRHETKHREQEKMILDVVHKGECMCKEREGPGQSPGETARRRGAAVLRDSVAASRPRGLELLLLLGGEPVKPEEGGDSRGGQHMY